MKRYYLLSLIMLVLMGTIHGQDLKAHLNYYTFLIPEEDPYIETCMLVEGRSAVFVKNDHDKYQATIEVLILFKQGEKIVEFDKYEFNSPELTDTLSQVNRIINFMDQHRYVLPNGTYQMEITLSDKHATQKPYHITREIVINYPTDEIALSDIMFVDSYTPAEEPSMLTRYGYNIIPSVFHFYPDSRKELSFLAEIYHTEKVLGAETQYLVSAYIENEESGERLNAMGRSSLKEAKPVTVILQKLDIQHLPSGNYQLVIALYNEANELLLEKKQRFQRSNPLYDVQADNHNNFSPVNTLITTQISLDSLRKAVNCLIPRASNSEKIFIQYTAPQASRKELIQFFDAFWTKRAGNNAQSAWLAYNDLVQYSTKKFGNGIHKGYEMGRGYYFCKYGRPDHVVGNRMHSAVYPYEIWHYYNAGNQRNVRLVFYTRDIAKQTYEILHTTLIEDINNPHWVYMLWRQESAAYIEYEEANQTFDETKQSFMDYYGNKILEEFNSPY